ncbi:winged helix-turn-helix domain-containing protein [Streptomyces sp. GMY02]|uniref:winged helix-turn-helix domain-containing protein n=1 Tax=Streptomyces sp. GMY02 TaxID=1333528 RepID=UPI001C2BFF77|nr:winged helix-turn-helix domain-containing protein [Streptomyces sp. GMY02]QXE37231.1 winged helix-turn-helix domain-containing protein [Streptomyces sp. GMY02]
MANSRSLSAASAAALNQKPAAPGRHRLRAVDRDETAPAARPAAVPAGGQVVDFLPPGATWLPAPQHTLPALPGQPPMIGYLVLVPADQQAAVLAASAPYRPAGTDPAAPGAEPGDGPGPGDTTADGFGARAGDGGPVRIDSAQRIAVVDGKTLDLTYLEFELLAHLVAHPHRVHTRDQLVTTVWGYGHVGDGRTVDVHVARLRRKLGAEYRHTIQTVRRVGYKYTP